jgi:hypothetical protein
MTKWLLSQSSKVTSVLKMLIVQTMRSRFSGGKQLMLTVCYGLEWPASVLSSLFSRLTGDVASAMK